MAHPSDPVRFVLDAELSEQALEELFAAAWPGPQSSRDFRSGLEHSLCWVSAHAGSRLVGFVKLAWDGGAHAFVVDPTVHPDYRRRGLGVGLVRRAMEAARARGLEWVHVDYEPHLAEFYRRCGFRGTAAGVLELRREPAAPLDRVAGLGLTPFSASLLEPCRALLSGLGEWFEPPAIEAYAADLARFPSWVAYLDEAASRRVVGCVTVTAPQPTAFEVHLLAVAKERHGSGVGSGLLEVAERWARRCGARFLLARTLGPSVTDLFYARSRAFYLARGFAPLFETPRRPGEPPMLVLVKGL